MKITPMLYVDRIEPCLAFWVDRLGFEKTVGVPEGDHLGFVILQHSGAEVMLQTVEGAQKDTGEAAAFASRSKAALFIEVDDFDAIVRKTEGVEVIVPTRDTFYGMREITVREPGGNLLCFAYPLAADQNATSA